MERQVKSKQRVSDFGEVYTAHRQVTDMLDLIPAEAAGIDTTYLEPACGNGNFIVEILKRKFALITAKGPWTYSIFMLRCVASVYGVDIQKDNTMETVERIVTTAEKVYEKVFHCLPDALVTDAVRKIASRNIIWEIPSREKPAMEIRCPFTNGIYVKTAASCRRNMPLQT